MRLLCDSNVFLALTLAAHPHHSVAVAWIGGMSTADTACFCRSTQQAYLRLLTVEAFLGREVRSNEEAAGAWRTLLCDSRIGFLAVEPMGLETRWLQLANHSSPSPKLWMDAYLAAFAICGQMPFVTFDRGFRQFVPQGLALELLR